MRDAGCRARAQGSSVGLGFLGACGRVTALQALDGHKGRPEVLGQGAGTVSPRRKESRSLPSSGGDGGIHPACGRGMQALTTPWLSEL